MSKIVVQEDPALAMIAGWEDELDVTLSLGSKEVLTRAVQHGRLDYADNVFTLRLAKPIEQKDGKTIDELKIGEPTGRDIVNSTKGVAQQEQQIRLLSNLTGIPVGVMERIGSRDLYAAVAVLDFFA
jgi:hypothetical protein